MKFLKSNSYDIVKLFINQIGITIFSLVLYTAVGFVEDEALNTQLRIILSIFATLFYFALIYTATWEIGAKDFIRVDGGKAERTRAKGFLISLVSNVPNFVLALGAIVFLALHMANGSDACFSAFAVFNFILRFIAAMFLGILEGIFGSLETNMDYLLHSIGYFIAPFITAGVAQLGYTFGEKNIKILSIFSIKGNGKKS